MKLKHALASVCIVLALLSCTKEPEPVKVTGISLNATSLTLTEGDTQTLSATISPNNADNKVVIWSTSDMSVATVDNNGLVKGVAPGTVTITAKSDDGGKIATCSVTVNAKFIPVESVTLDKSSVELIVSETTTLTATVKPDDATDRTVTWSSSNEAVATVSDGKITAVQVGSATITAKAGDKFATCTITVKGIEVTSVELDKTSAELKAGGTVTLTATVKPDNATSKTVTWTSTNESVATVVEGVVTAVKVGSATIIAKAGEKIATCSVTVIPTEVTSIDLDYVSCELKVGRTVTLKATVKPDDATVKTVTWASSDENVATVTDGLVTAEKVGSATITAKAGDKTATCSIKVIPIEVTSVELDKISVELKEGEAVTLTATVKPDDATVKTVKWSSSDESVASVADGVVSALKAGQTKITVTTEDGGKQASCEVTVKSVPKAVSISLTGAEFLSAAKIGEEFSIGVKVEPSDARVELEWSVSDENIAVINGSGANISLMTKAFGSAKLIVKDKISDLSISKKIQTYVEDFYWYEPNAKTHNGSPMVEIEVGDEHQLGYKCKPETATNLFQENCVLFYEPINSGGEPILLVSEPKFFSLDVNGKIVGLKPGLTKIDVTFPINKRNSSPCLFINVVPIITHVTSISLNKSSLELAEGTEETLVAEILPTNASNKNIIWSSSDDGIAKVTDGKVAAIKVGEATITARTEDGDKVATCSVTVVEKPEEITEITLDFTSLKLLEGETTSLKATIKPESLSGSPIYWTSDNEAIATVSNGAIQAKAKGTANITASCGSKSEVCVVTVSDQIADFISSAYTGGAIKKINDLIQYGSKLNFAVYNSTISKTITVKTVQLIDGETGDVGNPLSINQDISANSNGVWTITIGLAGIHNPTAKFIYTYEGKEYSTEAKYFEISF